MWFTPPGALIIEFFPLAPRCAYVALGSFWCLLVVIVSFPGNMAHITPSRYHAPMFGHQYAMLVPSELDRQQNMRVDTSSVIRLLEAQLE